MSVIDRHIKQLQSLFAGKIQALIGARAVEFFDESFSNKGFTDRKLEKWKPVMNRATGREKERPLVESGRMRRGTRHQSDGMVVEIYNDVPYASYHNKGGEKEGRPPQRQFIGESKKLEEELEEMIVDELDKIFYK